MSSEDETDDVELAIAIAVEYLGSHVLLLVLPPKNEPGADVALLDNMERKLG